MTYDLNTPAVARLWPHQPDWSGGYEITRSFRTDQFASRNNTEQRRALRQVARLSAKYRSVVESDDLRAANQFLRARQNRPVAAPDFSRAAALTGASLSGVSTLTLASPPAWAAAGFLAVLCGADAIELVRITDVAGSTITLADPLGNTWPTGSTIRPALHGLLAAQIAGNRYHRGAAQMATQLSIYPGGEPIEDEGAADATYNGYEVFPAIEPDWSAQPALSYVWPVEQVDYGIGRTAQFRPVDEAERLTEAQFNVSAADAVLLEQFFLRMKGMRGSFYRPTTEKDFALAATATTGSNTFLAAGTELAEDFGAASPAAIQIVMTDGTRLHRTITGMTIDGANTEVTVNVNWPSDLTAATVARISWMPLTRFASDDLTTAWRSPASATIRCGFQSLRIAVVVDVVSDFFENFTGLSWKLPCGGHTGTGCYCSSTTSSAHAFQGDPDVTYNATFRIRGVVEFNGYTGGSLYSAPYVYKDVASGQLNINIYKIVVSDPPASYYLNKGLFTTADITAIDYNLTIPIQGGATITLYADSVEGGEIRNVGNHSAADDDPDAPIVVAQPYDGQFMQLDAVGLSS